MKKKTERLKLQFEAATVRALTNEALATVAGGFSAGPCSGSCTIYSRTPSCICDPSL